MWRSRFCGMVVLACVFGAAAAAQSSRAVVSLPGVPAPIRMDTIGIPVELPAEFARVFLAAELAFEGLQVPLEVRDSIGGHVGNLRLVRSRRLAGANLSQYLSCGATMTGLRADSYRLTMPLLVLLDRLPGDRTRVRVALVASARDMSGPSTEPVACSSTGALEGRITRSIEQHLAASGR